MEMTVSAWVALGAAVVSLLSFFDRIISRRGDATAKSIKQVDDAWKEEWREAVDNWKEEMRLLRQETDQRIGQLHARILEQQAAISQVKLDVVQGTINVPTREQMVTAINAALAPVARHMERTERFMDDIYKSGVLSNRD